MRERGERTARKAWRRLGSTRGTAYLEFAVLVPFFLFAFFFAADFTRILYCEQQVEIASRALCDIECHLESGLRDRDGKVGSACPAWHGKRAVRRYLSEALAKEGLIRHGLSTEDAVYCRAGFYTQQGLLHTIANTIINALKPTGDESNKFIAILKAFFGGVVNLLTLRTFGYIEKIIPTDKVVRASVSVLIEPLMPNGFYTLFGRHHSKGVMLIPAAAPRFDGNRGLAADRRVRYYCHMPSFDTAPIAPPTYVRELSKVFPKSWFSWD